MILTMSHSPLFFHSIVKLTAENAALRKRLNDSRGQGDTQQEPAGHDAEPHAECEPFLDGDDSCIR
jgi:hypothetical protein